MQIVTGQTSPELDYTGFSNYDAANVLERASRLKLVQSLRRPCAASSMKNLCITCYLKWNVSLVLKNELSFSVNLILIFLTFMWQMAFLTLIFIGQVIQYSYHKKVDEGLVPIVTILSLPQHTFENS